MGKHTKQWLLVLVAPYLLLDLVSGGSLLLLLPLGGGLGVFQGVFQSGAYGYGTLTFRLCLAFFCLLCLFAFVVGFKFREHLWGKAMCSISVLLWCLAGLIGFGPV